MGRRWRFIIVARAWKYLMEFPMAKVRNPIIRKMKILGGYSSRYDRLSSIFKKEIRKRKVVFLCLVCGGRGDEGSEEGNNEMVIGFGSELFEKISDEEEEEGYCVDKRAEEFIERFYKKMRLERQQSLEMAL